MADREGAIDGSAAARERAAEMIGRTLSDRYRIVELIAMGGMGAVYRAEHLTMRKQIAVKVLHPDVEDFPEMVARFEREAVAGAHIQHPNVATASDFGKFDGESRFLVLELVDGITLRDFIDRGPAPPARACRIARHVASGLAAVHQKGIVHRDLKPQNIMLVDATRETNRFRLARPGDMDVVKLIDFGLAKVPVDELSALAQDVDSPQSALTRAGMVVGTMGYLAPEAALGAGSITPLSDLYALGVILYQMLCGKPPFEGKNAAEMFAQHRGSPVPRLSERNPAVRVPSKIEAVVRRLLEKDPANRYRSAGALVAALDEAIEAVQSEKKAAQTVLAAPNAAPRTRRKSGNTWLFGAAGVAVAAALIAFWASSSGKVGAAKATVAAAETASASDPSSAVAGEAAPSVVASTSPRVAPAALDRLRKAADEADPQRALALLLELAASEKSVFADRAMQSEAATVIEAAANRGVSTEPIFTRITNELGSDGIDILYDLVVREQRAGAPLSSGLAPPSTAGARARALLASADVLQRGTVAMRIAYELLRATCMHRQNLFPRAAEEGDDRALEILRSMERPACSRTGGCCFGSRQLERAITDIQARLRQ